MQLGATLSGLGGAATIAYWIFTLQSPYADSFWSTPGYASLAVLTLGLVLVGAAVVAPNYKHGEPKGQTIKSGMNSTNYQAGRDIRVEK